IPGLLFLGTGLAVSNALAVLDAYFGHRDAVFERTPKSGGEKSSLYATIPSRSLWLELGLALYLVGCILIAAIHGLWASIPFLAVFAIGFGGVGYQSLVERVAQNHHSKNWPRLVRPTGRARR
ncbi:MAG: hypothetical protein KC978_06375, partial [Candidatus Omnitrophica bacterium]|nr:hypothetical protein [Candidatus Omnitrophota bacterium]